MEKNLLPKRHLQPSCSHSNTIYAKAIVFCMQPQQRGTLPQPLQCVLQRHVSNPHVSTRMATKIATIMQPFHCDLQPQIPKHPITTHTQTHPKQLQPTVTVREPKKHQTDRSRTRRTHSCTSSPAGAAFTRKNTRFRAPASSPKQTPCNIHAAIKMPFAAPRGRPACIYAHGNRT